MKKLLIISDIHGSSKYLKRKLLLPSSFDCSQSFDLLIVWANSFWVLPVLCLIKYKISFGLYSFAFIVNLNTSLIYFNK